MSTEKNNPVSTPVGAYPISRAPVMRAARFGPADAHTPTPKAPNSRLYGTSISANTRGLTGDPEPQLAETVDHV